MSDRSDLERDIAEEDELRALLRSGDRDLRAPAFEAVERRARQRRRPFGLAEAGAGIAIVLAIGFAVSRATAPAASPSAASALPTASPELAVPRIGGSAPPSVGICPEPPRPAYLPWPSSSSQTTTSMASTVTKLFGPGPEPDAPRVIVALSLVERPSLVPIDPAAQPQAIDGREVVAQAGAAQASWRLASAPCPLVTVALAWPEKDAATLQAELQRVVASMPAIGVGPAASPQSESSYGLIVQDRAGRFALVREGDGKLIASLGDAGPPLAVSPDGRRLAYVRANGRELWVAQVSDLGRAGRILAVEGERVTSAVWSPDGSSLMFAAASAEFEPVTEGAPVYTALRVVQEDGSRVRELARLADHQFVRALAWDPARDLGAAVEGLGQKGPGRYVIVSEHRALLIENGRSSKVRYMDLPDAGLASVSIGALQSSDDDRFVMATWNYGDRSLVRFWPLEGLDLGGTRELSPERAGDALLDARWRPRSHEIGVNVAGTFELWTLDGQRRRVADVSGRTVMLSLRYDGTALYSSSLNSDRVMITDLTGASPPRRVTLGGWIVGSADLR